jgi:hypothetical protein
MFAFADHAPYNLLGVTILYRLGLRAGSPLFGAL